MNTTNEFEAKAVETVMGDVAEECATCAPTVEPVDMAPVADDVAKNGLLEAAKKYAPYAAAAVVGYLTCEYVFPLVKKGINKCVSKVKDAREKAKAKKAEKKENKEKKD